MGILRVSEPPSAGRFWPGQDRDILAPMLYFLRRTKAPLMVNPYSYFGYSPKMDAYALFKPNPGLRDNRTGIVYTNMFDATLDATYSAAKSLGYGDVDIAIGETGWPSVCEGLPCSPQIAMQYNANLIKHVSSGKGTPLMPNRKFETYIFALFNENLKPGPVAEQNWGLFRPDFTPVYDAGIMRSGQVISN